MKELSIEEKAQRYDEAIEKAKAWCDCEHATTDDKILLKRIFPELAESEDERIRNGLIGYFRAGKCENISSYHGISTNDILAWLEKQGEHLENFDEAEKEKSDFVGDGFIKCFANFLDFKEGNTYWLEYMGDDKYNVRSDNLLGKTYHITPCQLYTVFKKLTWLEKQSEQKHKIQPKFKIGDIIRFKGNETLKGEAETHKIVSYDNELYVFADGTTDLFCEQDLYELVEQNLADKVEPKFKKGQWVVWQNRYYKVNDNGCGYELIDQNGLTTSLEYWTVEESAHLWNIAKDAKDGGVLSDGDYLNNLPKDNWEFIREFITKFGRMPKDEDELNVLVQYVLKRQKPAWSEEDKNMLNEIIICGEHHCYLDAENIAWLKSLKDRVQPQNLTVTDEELAQAKKNAYNDALDKIEYHSGEPTFDDGWSAAIWYLKKRISEYESNEMYHY